MYIITLTYVKPLDEIEAQLDAHRAFLRERYDSGMFLMSGRMVPRTGGIIVAQADSRAAIDAAIARDPFMTAGVASYHVAEFVPTMTAAFLSDFRRE